jgi:homocysteine S-methyltransferase
MNFESVISSQPLLVEGSMYDRLQRLASSSFDPDLAHMGLVYSEEGRAALRATYEAYIHAAESTAHPIIVFTPTWRCNSERVAKSSLNDRNVNIDAVEFVRTVCDSQNDKSSIFIGGLIGCRNDCYTPSEALSPFEATQFHSVQVDQLAGSQIDFLFASTLPAVSEATGIAQAMSKTSLPYILSFVVDDTGSVLDGHSLSAAIKKVDASCERPPLGYFVNCVHPDIMMKGLKDITDSSVISKRLIGFQGNTSRRDPREFDALKQLETEAPEDFALATIQLRDKFGINALGGCCGTGPEHIKAIGQLLQARI